jgi:hypothetical protein
VRCLSSGQKDGGWSVLPDHLFGYLLLIPDTWGWFCPNTSWVRSAEGILEDVFVFEDDFVGVACDSGKDLYRFPSSTIPGGHDIALSYSDVDGEYFFGTNQAGDD